MQKTTTGSNRRPATHHDVSSIFLTDFWDSGVFGAATVKALLGNRPNLRRAMLSGMQRERSKRLKCRSLRWWFSFFTSFSSSFSPLIVQTPLPVAAKSLSNSRGLKSATRRPIVERSMRISRTALSCLLRLKDYGTYPAGAAFGAGRTPP